MLENLFEFWNQFREVVLVPGAFDYATYYTVIKNKDFPKKILMHFFFQNNPRTFVPSKFNLIKKMELITTATQNVLLMFGRWF